MTDHLQTHDSKKDTTKDHDAVHKAASHEARKHAEEKAAEHGRPCESSAVFEAWAQH